MFEKLKNLLNNIQNSDEITKKRWLIASSAVAMVLVVSLWLIYINNAIQPADNNINIEKQESEIGFFQIFKNGLNVAGESIWGGAKNFILKITGERIIIIE